MKSRNGNGDSVIGSIDSAMTSAAVDARKAALRILSILCPQDKKNVTTDSLLASRYGPKSMSLFMFNLL